MSNRRRYCIYWKVSAKHLTETAGLTMGFIRVVEGISGWMFR
jgi:hypothetical protein